MTTCSDVLSTVVENGRVSGNDDGEFNVEELIVEVEFEAAEQGLDPDECVEFALEHTKHT